MLALVANFSVPPFFRIVGELSILFSLFCLDLLYLCFLGLVLYLVSYYCVYLIRVITHGRMHGAYSYIFSYDIFFLLARLHIFMLLILVLKMSLVSFCFNSLIKIKNCGFLDKNIFKTVVIFWFVAPVLSLVLSLFYFLYVEYVWVISYTLGALFFFDFRVVLIFDFFSLLFFFTVILITFVVFYYSQYYMDGEPSLVKFLLMLRVFVLSMVFLIFSPSLLFLLLGWDGLGVTSYLLVVYYLNYSRSVAGIVTFLVNRLGDIFFFSSLGFLFLFVDWRFFEHKFYFWGLVFVMAITFITKRAQVPFSSWLPAAMAAPTPVSSLVHSSTLVTAGVYLFIRFSNIIQQHSLVWLFTLSSITILLAGVIANCDWDLKKIVAFSTLSQLGFMMCSYRVGLTLFCFFHLLTHALFKASLFMCSGVIIHSSDNSQDFRNSPSFVSLTPLLCVCILICLLCLCGFPFTSGFYSKDFILDGAVLSVLRLCLFFTGVIITFLYSVRFGSFVFSSFIKAARTKSYSATERILYVVMPIISLVFCALVLGAVWVDRAFLLCYSLLTTLGWKFFYWGFVFQITLLSLYFFSSFILILRKYYFSSIWFLSNIVGFRRVKKIILWGQHVVLKLDQGYLELVGPSFWMQGLLGLSYKTILSYLVFLFSFFFFFFFIV